MSIETPVLRVVLVEKRNSISYLEALFAGYRERKVVMPIDVGASLDVDGLSSDERVRTIDSAGWFSLEYEPVTDDGLAQVSLTSGTTGRPKAIVLSHRALSDVTFRLIEIMRLDATVREYIGVPVTFSFGHGRARAIAAVGGQGFIPERGFRVDELARMIEDGQVNSLSAVPTQIRLLLEQARRFASCGAKLKWLEIGSQAMTLDEKLAVRELFPNARIIQHYGLTEASRTTFLDISESDNAALSSVGSPIGDVEVRITDDGLIAIRGPHVADGMVAADGIQPLTDEDGWLVTRDLGHEENGHLFFDGRIDDLINVGGIKVSPEFFEDRVRDRIGATFPFAIARGRDAVRGEILVVGYESTANSTAQAELKAAISSIAADFGVSGAVAYLPLPAIPRTDTGKVRRSEISSAFEQIVAPPPAVPKGAAQNDVVTVFQKVFGPAGADPAASFTSLGGDSLNYVTVLSGLEHLISALPDTWPDLPIGELQALAAVSHLGDQRSSILDAYVEVFGTPARDEAASFNSLGGDSLTYIRILVALEEQIPDLPEDWETLSIASLTALAMATKAPSQQAREKNRLFPKNLDSVRGLSCCLVVALHVVGVAPDEGLKIPAGSAWHDVMQGLQLIRMPLFTALAGFLYAAMPARPGRYGGFITQKARQLLIPLVFATLVFFTLRGLTYGFNDSLFWAFAHSYQHLWYLDTIFMIFALVGFLDSRFLPRTRIWFAIIACIFLVYTPLPNFYVLQFKNTLFLLPCFIWGMLLYKSPQILRNNALLAVSVVVIVATVYVREFQYETFRPWFKTSLPQWACGFASAIAAIRLFPKVKWLERIAPYTFTIYLWHPAASATFRTVMVKLGLDSIPVLFVLCLIVGVTVPIVLHQIATRMPRWISLPTIGR